MRLERDEINNGSEMNLEGIGHIPVISSGKDSTRRIWYFAGKGSKSKPVAGKEWFGAPFAEEVMENMEDGLPAQAYSVERGKIGWKAPRGKREGDIWVSDGGTTYQIVRIDGELRKIIINRTDPHL